MADSIERNGRAEMVHGAASDAKKADAPRWPIKREYREALMTHLMMLGIDRKSTPMEVYSAAKLLLAAEVQNQKDEHRAGMDWDGKLTVYEDPNWYGNDVHLRLAEAAAEEAKQANHMLEGKEGG